MRIPGRTPVLATFVLMALALPVELGAGEDRPLTSDELTFFEQKIRPLLIERCFECHSTGKETKGGLRLDTRAGWQQGGDSGPAIVPGKPAESLIIKAVRYLDAD